MGEVFIRSLVPDCKIIVVTGREEHEHAVRAIAEGAYDFYQKPIDADTLQAAAEVTGRIVTVEDHYPEGGVGDAVLAALAERNEHARVVKLAVNGMPHSGKPDELLHAFGIDAESIATAVRQVVGEPVTTS